MFNLVTDKLVLPATMYADEMFSFDNIWQAQQL